MIVVSHGQFANYHHWGTTQLEPTPPMAKTSDRVWADYFCSLLWWLAIGSPPSPLAPRPPRRPARAIAPDLRPDVSPLECKPSIVWRPRDPDDVAAWTVQMWSGGQAIDRIEPADGQRSAISSTTCRPCSKWTWRQVPQSDSFRPNLLRLPAAGRPVPAGTDRPSFLSRHPTFKSADLADLGDDAAT
jgi:hypothetical protein